MAVGWAYGSNSGSHWWSSVHRGVSCAPGSRFTINEFGMVSNGALRVLCAFYLVRLVILSIAMH